MTTKSVEVLLLGCGISTLSAALESRSRGVSTACVHAGVGGWTSSSGAFGGCCNNKMESFQAACTRVIETLGKHGYAIAHREQPFRAITPAGGMVSTNLLAEGVVHRELLEGKQALWIGLDDWLYDPRHILAALAKNGLPRPNDVTRLLVGPAPGIWDRQDTTISLARRLDDQGESLTGWIDGLGGVPEDVDLVVLPPVLGIEAHAEVRSRISEALGVPCYELLSLVPSVHGLRLQQTICKALEGSVERVYRGQVQELRPNVSIRLASGGTEVLDAKRVIIEGDDASLDITSNSGRIQVTSVDMTAVEDQFLDASGTGMLAVGLAVNSHDAEQSG